MHGNVADGIFIFVQVGRQAIHYAAGVGNMTVVKLLIERFKVGATTSDKVTHTYVLSFTQ